MKGTPCKDGLGYDNPVGSNHNFLLKLILISQNRLDSFKKWIVRDRSLIATFHTATVC